VPAPLAGKLALPNATANMSDYSFNFAASFPNLPQDVVVQVSDTSKCPTAAPCNDNSGYSTCLKLPNPGLPATATPQECDYLLTSPTVPSLHMPVATSFIVLPATATPQQQQQLFGAGGGGPGGGGKGANPANQGNQQQSATPSPSPSQPVDCTDVSSTSPCTFTRTFTVDDREFWDVSLGISIPGPVEKTYVAASATAPIVLNTDGQAYVAPTKKTHTDAYVFFDFYPLAHVEPKDGPLSFHLHGGIPITSQPLHRPYIGMGVPLTKWLEKKGLPIEIDAFGGIVAMKQTVFVPDPNTKPVTGTYKLDWAWRPIWGIEVPIGAITGKLSSKSSSSKGSSSPGGKSGN
jgi:hypothetical protein